MRIARSLFPAAALVAATAFPFRVHAQATPPAPPAAGQDEKKADKKEDKDERKGHREGHPAIRSAMRHLEKAKADLNRASHDFGGHRAEALKAVDEGLMHLRLALQADKK